MIGLGGNYIPAYMRCRSGCKSESRMQRNPARNDALGSVWLSGLAQKCIESVDELLESRLGLVAECTDAVCAVA